MYRLIYLSGVFLMMSMSIMACNQDDKSGSQKQQDDITSRMAREHEGDKPVAAAAMEGAPSQPVRAEEVTYATIDNKPIKGYLSMPEQASGSLPGIIVIHEWWGLNDNIRTMTRKLAGEGYTALAVDLYNGQVASTPDSAQALMREAMQDEETGKENLRQAYAYLSDELNAPKIGVVGWCFGGGWSLTVALTMPDKIDATVIYYGRLVTDADQLAPLSMPIMGNFGAEDHGIPPGTLREFESALDSLGKTNDIKIYDGAGHAFANPSGTRYQPKAAQDAWQRTLNFFNKYLKRETAE